ncbi:MAG: hydrogenase maturation nickel metallochaperone HypA [bacterium]|nr:hydrogenase maturation nickel metallochaperone HypA [bacterium]
MHELKIAESIVDSVSKEMERRGLKSLRAVGLRIGELTDIVPESLEFGFNAIVAATPMEGVRLEIERVPITGRCRDCGAEFAVRDFQFLCPTCEGRGVTTVGGNELEICYLEVDDPHSDKRISATA